MFSLRLKIFLSTILSLCALSFLCTSPVFAARAEQPPGPDIGLGYGAYSGLELRDPRLTVATGIRVALGFLGIIFLVITLYAGFLWMTAGGNEDNITSAKKWLFGGVIGLAIILSSYAITSFVVRSIIKSVQPQYFDEAPILENYNK